MSNYQITRVNEIELENSNVEESPIRFNNRDRAPTFSPHAPDNAPTVLTFEKN